MNNTLHAHAWFDDSGDVFARNLVMTPYQPYQPNNKGNNVDFNIFTDSLSFNKARELGHDAHSIVSSVVFANPKEGNYTLKDDSDAVRKGGFMNIPMDRFGVQSPRLKKIAKEPVMDSLNMPDYAGGDDIWYWKNNRD